MYSLEQLHNLTSENFIKTFENVVEHYPKCAEHLAANRPYNNVQKLVDTVNLFLLTVITFEGESINNTKYRVLDIFTIINSF